MNRYAETNSGPDHYREAERLIDRAHTLQSDNGPGCGSEEELAEAQTHATLALVDKLDQIAGATPKLGDPSGEDMPVDLDAYQAKLRKDTTGPGWCQPIHCECVLPEGHNGVHVDVEGIYHRD